MSLFNQSSAEFDFVDVEQLNITSDDAQLNFGLTNISKVRISNN